MGPNDTNCNDKNKMIIIQNHLNQKILCYKWTFLTWTSSN